jgi:hypothetical protein
MKVVLMQILIIFIIIKNIKNNNQSFIKSILLSYKPKKNTTINSSYYSGFRNPNIDDMGKIFSKDGINVVVPNKILNLNLPIIMN